MNPKYRIALRVAAIALAGFLAGITHSPATAQSTAAQAIVNQFFPQALLTKDANLGFPLDQRSSYVVYDALKSGAPKTIVACYTDNWGGAIRVIQAQSDGSYAVVFEEPPTLDLGGMGCAARLVDASGDDAKDIRVTFYDGNQGNSADWVFTWEGTQLTDIGPAQADDHGLIEANTLNATFYDLYHDGTLQIYSVGEYPPSMDGSLPTVSDQIYRLVNGHYVPDKPVLAVVPFVRAKGAPQTVPVGFSLVQGSTGPYVLRVINGDKHGHNRVSSAHIVLNGTEVVGPSQFNQQVELISVPVTNLLPQNTLQVTLEGKPGGEIIVTVEDTSAVNSDKRQAAVP